MTRDQIHREIGELVHEQLSNRKHALNSSERRQLVDDILDELLGLGPLEPLLKDPTITDVLVNSHKTVFVERFGVLEETAARFKDEKHLMRVISKIVSAVGRRVDESSPMVRSEEHTSELQSLMRISYAVFCLKKTTQQIRQHKK